MEWIPVEFLLNKLFIKHGVPQDWDGGEYNIIALINDWLVQGLSTKGGEEAKPVQREDINVVLIEHV